MKDGKKHSALRIIDDALVHLRVKHNVADPVTFTKQAIDKAKPLVELRRYKASGRALQIPAPCSPARQESLATRFIRDAFRLRKERGSGLRLAAELHDLGNGTGGAFKRREEMHKKAEANRAFAHFVR